MNIQSLFITNVPCSKYNFGIVLRSFTFSFMYNLFSEISFIEVMFAQKYQTQFSITICSLWGQGGVCRTRRRSINATRFYPAFGGGWFDMEVSGRQSRVELAPISVLRMASV